MMQILGFKSIHHRNSYDISTGVSNSYKYDVLAKVLNSCTLLFYVPNLAGTEIVGLTESSD